MDFLRGTTLAAMRAPLKGGLKGSDNASPPLRFDIRPKSQSPPLVRTKSRHYPASADRRIDAPDNAAPLRNC
jgi:hypothetical protein